MALIKTLETIEAAPQGNARLEIIKQNDCLELRDLLNYSLSPFVTFGLKAVPEPKESQVALMGEDEWWHELKVILDQLANRTLTGNEAKSVVASFLGLCSGLEQKWTFRIIKQDLRINIGAKEVNSVLGKNTIYIFEVPLATDYNKCKPKDLIGNFYVQPKLDGARCVATLPLNGEVRLYSRTGKEWESLNSIKNILQEFNDSRKDNTGTIYLDGEVISIVNNCIDFQAIQKVMHRKDGLEIGDLKFIVFDASTEVEWKTPILHYSARLGYAKNIIDFIHEKTPKSINKIELIDTTKLITNPQKSNIDELCKRSVESGYEGLILRKSDFSVENKRGKRLLKYKNFTDTEATIVGTAEGIGKLIGMLGALVCKTHDDKQFEIGSGFSDEVRKELWDTRNEIIGRTVNYKYFEFTDDNIPRFPIYRGLRSDDDTPTMENT